MTTHAQAEAHVTATTSTFVWVWIWLVSITGIEVFLAYVHLEPRVMLTILLGLSVIKAGLIMSYFMHLKFEKFSLVLWLVPALLFCIGLILAFFLRDSVRLLNLRPH